MTGENGNDPASTAENGAPADQLPDVSTIIPAEVLERLPPAQRQQLMTAVTTMLSVVGPMPHPIAAKMTSTHISKVLDLQEKEMAYSFEDRKDSRLQATVVFLVIIALGVLVILALALLGHEQILGELVPIGAGLAGGFGGGYAVGRRRGP